MLIALIIVSILLLLSLILIYGMHQVILEQIQMIVNPDLYPCRTFYLVVRFNQPEDRTLTDFSRYEKEKIVFQSIDIAHPPQDNKEKIVDGKLIQMKSAVLYKIGDEYLWKQ